MNYKSPLHEMSLTTPTQFWNDSCSVDALDFAISHGAVGATTNPVIVGQVLEAEMEKYAPVIKALAAENPRATEDEITWLLNERMAADGAERLKPVFEATAGKAGYISIQVNTKYYRDAARMTEQAVHFSSLAENVMVKIPATSQGIIALEECTYRGVNVNATVSFSVAQALAAAEAVKRGLERRKAQGLSNVSLHPVCTIMVGRVDDWLNEVKDAQNIIVDPQAIAMSGVAVFKNAYRIYRERGYGTRLLAAAYRHHHHWSELIGGDVSMTIPPLWIRRFTASDITVENRMDEPVDPRLLAQLKKHFPDFVKAYEPDGMAVEEFDRYGATVRTLNQFLNGYDKAVGMIRKVITV
jgi:transaldolase